MHTRTTIAAIAATTLALAVAGCTATPDSDTLTIDDPWIKAVDEGMTAAFGTLTNGTGDDIVIVGADVDVSPMTELHETVAGDDGAMMMRERDGGFPIAAGADLVLAPGGNHIMLMGVTEALEPGAEIVVTLLLDDGTEFAYTAVVKDYAGANEEYVGDMDHGDE